MIPPTAPLLLWFHQDLRLRDNPALIWQTLVDADLANNTLGWQWIAGCGADASPYFRIFSPERQSRKFDPAGEFIRRWVPELRGLNANDIHAPGAVSAEVLRAAGVRLGDNYPRPIVDHAEAQVEALAAFKAMRQWSARRDVPENSAKSA